MIMNSTTDSRAIGRIDREVLIWALIILASVLLAVVNFLMNGEAMSTVMVVTATLIFVLSFLRPSISLYVLTFLAIAIEQGELDYGWTKGLRYHWNLNLSFPDLAGVSINPLEIHLILILAGLSIQRSVFGKERMRVAFLAKKNMFLYISAVVFFVIYGITQGGSFLPALWEVRGIFYLVFLMYLVPQVIRTRDQVHNVLWAIILAFGFRAIEVCFHYFSAGMTLEGSDAGWGNHEDAGLLLTMIFFCAMMFVLKVKGENQRHVLTALVLPMVIAIIASDRRTVYPIFAGCLVLIPTLMPKDIQRKALKLAGVGAVFFAVYLGVFWNSGSRNPIVRPAQLIREGIGADDKDEMLGQVNTSNLYRRVENYDLFNMIRDRPILGGGYGTLIDYRLPIPVQWDLGFYITHNQIMAVFAKTGIIGFTIFLMFYLSIIDEVARAFAHVAKDPYLRAVLMLAAFGVINHLVFSFFDIVLTYYRNNVYLGILFGLAAAVISIERQRLPKEEPQKPIVTTNVTPAQWLLKPHEEPVSQSTS